MLQWTQRRAIDPSFVLLGVLGVAGAIALLLIHLPIAGPLPLVLGYLFFFAVFIPAFVWALLAKARLLEHADADMPVHQVVGDDKVDVPD
ncbi:hypothetical protein [Allorhodopirellula solitaria]|uniref:Uncharacterized protein n=1 Tax=Allorhodopirellula solitaria TaxID=2527987 RepID=A0A5C5XNZ7_9BACT|nr:hypothetical protein [Allorhodopirellula solitaria]TWT64624.1 hypothetical protein CA85_37570 [Allorhodopirellula solitaria]